MEMINVTQIRKNIRSILLNVAKNRKPVAILQRSRPVAYIIDAESFDKLSSFEERESDTFRESRERSLERIALLRNRILKRTSLQGDSTLLIRELRENSDV